MAKYILVIMLMLTGCANFAASVSGTMLITEAVVSKIENKENTNPAGVDPNMLLG